jgi:2-polyprenyl-3-methyl-5-hydroxy-6-metoxy-1,4-benzoquinol methylase
MTIDHAAFEQDQNDFFRKTFDVDFEEATCIFNPNHKSVLLFEKAPRMRIHRCECGFVYNKHQPTNELLSRFYTKSRAMTTWASHKQTKDEDARQKRKYDRAVSWIKRNKIESICDLGCGTGRFLSMLPDEIERVGIDMNQDSLDVAEEYGVSTMRGETIPQEVTFDMISLWGVYEHVKDPISLAKSCWSNLNPGGYLLVCVPNLDSFLIHTIWSQASTFCPQHLWFFNEQTLSLSLMRAGFKPTKAWTIEPESLPVARFKAGFSPYRKDIPEPWLTKVTDLASEIEDMNEQLDNGYKIVGVYQR